MRITKKTRRQRRIWILTGLGAILLAFTAALFLWDPAQSKFFAPCPLHYITGCHCPGCGSLRAVHSLLHLQFARALSLNPLMVASIPVLAVMFFNPRWIYRRWIPWAALAILLAYGIARNLSCWRFTLLAPH